jgi:hypothetical protein
MTAYLKKHTLSLHWPQDSMEIILYDYPHYSKKVFVVAWSQNFQEAYPLFATSWSHEIYSRVLTLCPPGSYFLQLTPWPHVLFPDLVHDLGSISSWLPRNFILFEWPHDLRVLFRLTSYLSIFSFPSLFFVFLALRTIKVLLRKINDQK